MNEKERLVRLEVENSRLRAIFREFCRYGNWARLLLAMCVLEIDNA